MSKNLKKAGKAFKASKPDAKIRKEMADLDEGLHKLRVRHRAPDVQFDQHGKPLTNAFPAKLTAYDPQDNIMDMKVNAPAEFGVKMLETKDLEWLQRKVQNTQYKEFIDWIETYYDMRDPAIQRIVEEIIPDYYTRREEQIDEVADISSKVAKLRLRGPRSIEDLQIVYAIKNGTLPLPTGPIHDWKSWKTNVTVDDFNYGLFNPKRYNAPGLTAIDPMNRYDILGLPPRQVAPDVQRFIKIPNDTRASVLGKPWLDARK